MIWQTILWLTRCIADRINRRAKLDMQNWMEIRWTICKRKGECISWLTAFVVNHNVRVSKLGYFIKEYIDYMQALTRFIDGNSDVVCHQNTNVYHILQWIICVLAYPLCCKLWCAPKNEDKNMIMFCSKLLIIKLHAQVIIVPVIAP